MTEYQGETRGLLIHSGIQMCIRHCSIDAID